MGWRPGAADPSLVGGSVTCACSPQPSFVGHLVHGHLGGVEEAIDVAVGCLLPAGLACQEDV